MGEKKINEIVVSEGKAEISNPGSMTTQADSIDLDLFKQVDNIIDNKSISNSSIGNASYNTYALNILNSVIHENYDYAIREINSVKNLGETYPKFLTESSRYIEYAKTLVETIKDRRIYLSRPNISRSAKKKVAEDLKKNLQNLRVCVGNIEKIERKNRVGDISSTKFFIYTIYFTGAFIFSFFFFSYALPKEVDAVYVFSEDLIRSFVEKIFSFFE